MPGICVAQNFRLIYDIMFETKQKAGDSWSAVICGFLIPSITLTNELNKWKIRIFSLLAKVTVIKMSKLIHLLLSLSNPPKDVTREINTIVFLLNNGPDRRK